MDTVRHAPVGDVVRFVTKNKVLPYPEQRPDFKYTLPSERAAASKPVESSRTSSDGTLHDEHPHHASGPKDEGAYGEAIVDESRREEVERERHHHHGEKDVEKGNSEQANSKDKDAASSGDDEEVDDTLVTWYGDDDPENPQNWSNGKKLGITFILGLYTASVYICSAIYTPGIGLVEQEFGADQTEATLGLTLFVLGYSLAPLVLTPITMLPEYGRRNPYFISFFLYLAFLCGSAGVRNLPGFLVFRLLSGLAGSPAISTVGVSLSDFWPPLKAPRAIAVWGSFASIGPILGPLIGAAAILHSDSWYTWRSPLWLLACVSAFTLVCMFFFMPETSSATLLHQRMLRLKKATGRSDLRTEWQKLGINITILGTIKESCKAATDFSIAYVCIQIAFLYTVLYCWFEAMPYVFGQGGYGFGEVAQGVVYLGIGVGIILSVIAYLIWLVYVFEPSAKNGTLRPELFNQLGFVAVFSLPICLLTFGWSANRTSYWAPIIFSALFGPGAFFAFMTSLNYLMLSFPSAILPIFCLNAVSRGTIAAFGPLYADKALAGIGVGPWCSILAGVSVLMIPLPFIFYFKGEAIRKRSRYYEDPNKSEGGSPPAGH